MRSILRTILLAIAIVLPLVASAARSSSTSNGYWRKSWVQLDGQRVMMLDLLPIYCYSRKADMRRYARLIDAVKKVYPVAKIAREKIASMEGELDQMSTKKEQKAHVKEIYKELVEEYTPVLKRMTQTQGRILVRLIDRETEYTAYEVVREFRGSFAATFWQGIGRMFGQDLKSEYGSSEEDKIIEQIITYYEAGLL